MDIQREYVGFRGSPLKPQEGLEYGQALQSLVSDSDGILSLADSEFVLCQSRQHRSFNIKTTQQMDDGEPQFLFGFSS